MNVEIIMRQCGGCVKYYNSSRNLRGEHQTAMIRMKAREITRAKNMASSSHSIPWYQNAITLASTVTRPYRGNRAHDNIAA